MLHRPIFSPAYRTRATDEGVVLVREDGYVVLDGTVCTALAPLLDGTRTADEIAAALDGTVPPEQVYFTLMMMEREGYLTEALDADLPPGSAALWAALGVEVANAEARLHTRTVSISALGGLDPAPLRDLLAEMRVRCTDTTAGADLHVVLAADYLDPDLDALNRTALASGTPWLLVRPARTSMWIGPLLIPDETGCWACLATRLRVNRPAKQLLDAEPSTAHGPGWPSLVRTALGLTATEVVRWIAGAPEQPLQGRLLRFDAIMLEKDIHVLVRRPQCPVCGDPSMNTRLRPVRLEPCPKRFVAEGGFRAVSPEETLRRYEHHVSRITGVVRSLRRVPETGGLIHAYTAGHAARHGRASLRSLRFGTRDHSGGKGTTDLQARVSGLCEALEREASLFRGNEPRTVAVFRDLGEDAVHPHSLLCFSEKQYAERDAWNAVQANNFQYVPEPFDEREEIAWTKVWSLTFGRFRHVPTAYVYVGYDGPGRRFCRADSNGLAAGNTREEAILQAFLELAERDAVALWWYNRTRQPGVDLHSFDDPYVHRLVAHYRALGRDLWALDVTNDLGLSAFVALSRRVEQGPDEILMGFGCHFDARLALTRALTEVNQALPTVLRSPEKRAAQLLPDFASVLDWWATATLDNQPYLAPDPQSLRTADDFTLPTTDDIADDVRACIDRAARLDLEVLVLDLTRPDVGLPVVKVFVPGLRHFWKRLGPGRLYDVPVMLGRVPDALPADDLNPIPLFL